MSKVHITLVGGQTMPVYLGIKYCNPDKVVFVYSKDSEKQKQTIKKMFSSIEFLSSEPVSPVDLDEIEALANKFREKFSDDEVTVNISGGTKVWSYYFAKIFEGCPHATILYIDQNNEVYDLSKKVHEKIDFDFMMQFKLNKNPLQAYTEYSTYTQSDFDAIEEIQEIRKLDIGIFTKLTNLNKQKENELATKQKGRYSEGSSFIEWNKQGNCTFSISKNGSLVKKEVSSPNLINFIFNAGWFELKVARIMAEWQKTKHIYMNCKFPVIKNNFNLNQAIKNPKNEIDIIVDAGEKPLFIECKTTITNATDIDKFHTAVETYGGKGSKALFFCLNKFGEKESDKIRECNMLSYSMSDSSNIQELYEMLDRRIMNINK